jgi:hypothetical protein
LIPTAAEGQMIVRCTLCHASRVTTREAFADARSSSERVVHGDTKCPAITGEDSSGLPLLAQDRWPARAAALKADAFPGMPVVPVWYQRRSAIFTAIGIK